MDPHTTELLTHVSPEQIPWLILFLLAFEIYKIFKDDDDKPDDEPKAEAKTEPAG